MALRFASLLFLSLPCALVAASCVSSGDASTINNLFSAGGAGTIVQLCPNTVLSITAPIAFTAADQEISTQGYPTDSTRAIIQPASGSSVTTLINGYNLDGLRILNIQFDGLRPSLGLVPGITLIHIETQERTWGLRWPCWQKIHHLPRWRGQYRARSSEYRHSRLQHYIEEPSWLELSSHHRVG